jgi:hypothetical protein
MSWNASRKKSNKAGKVPVQIASQVKLQSQNIAIDRDVRDGVQSEHNTMANVLLYSVPHFSCNFHLLILRLFNNAVSIGEVM